jgi:hypothetical protein
MVSSYKKTVSSSLHIIGDKLVQLLRYLGFDDESKLFQFGRNSRVETFYLKTSKKIDEYFDVENPNMELSRKLHNLHTLENTLLAFVGTGNRIMHSYDNIHVSGSWNKVNRLLEINSALIQLFFQFFSSVNSKSLTNSDAKFHERLEKLLDDLDTELIGDENGKEEISSEKQILNSFQAFKQNFLELNTFLGKLNNISAENKPPSNLSRNWMIYSLSFLVGFGIIKYFQIEKEYFFNLMMDFRITVSHFWKRYIEEPLLSIYKTIRYDTSNFAVINEK